MPTYDLIKDILVSFDGDPETFLLQTYKVFPGCFNPFAAVHFSAVLGLGFEVSNYVLARVSGAAIIDNV